MAQVALQNIQKSFLDRSTRKPTKVLRGIDLNIQAGEFMVLVGASGCGKSTLLRLIAGLETVTGGEIWIGDRPVNKLPSKARDIAMVFQNYALYPHLNVYDNIAFGLRRMPTADTSTNWLSNLGRGVTGVLPKSLRYQPPQEKVIRSKVVQVAQLLQIDHLLTRLPKQLSGGQKQRVALGRAIARNPQVFLMDEPLSNLDAALRSETRTQIVQLQQQLDITTIYVTHDQTEAMTMGDRIAVMNEGEILQVAPPLEVYNYPVNRYVAEFIGSPPMNFLQVAVLPNGVIEHPQFRCTITGFWKETLKSYEGRSLLLGIRPEHLRVSPAATKNMEVTVDVVEALGNDTFLTAHLTEISSTTIRVRTEPHTTYRPQQSLWLQQISA
ncbi:carbohydrate ABC transporter ATP-binding protein, CUT1 family [[Leptolyngbya] sp. PCC 7376]|uniref:ABC transporter ATP-binding protein n=1 Tax=[Leptolyngbya] sp. PCC 7376 TaxID=111781 RepID=UPI00029EDAAC|nr:ABC transporter ATP-binding protein [[Leptolyngbya] sp. PCC 7376]AFY36833.1 carbohydrate ABC transporter ATP-binding protein, CUT1 family [[Leptolyngbya] sp. PCC 7376]